MIVVKLQGGLGNQMFQYAFAKMLAVSNNTGLQIDTSFLALTIEKNTTRELNLNCFKAKLDLINQNQLNIFLTNDSKPFLQRMIQKIKKTFSNSVDLSNTFKLNENQIQFDKTKIKNNKNIYIDGYWQSEQYFINISSIIKNEFEFKIEPNAYYSELIDKIITSNSVSIHIRRGDYIHNSLTNSFHGTCSIEYYNEAIEYLGNKVSNVQFFMISDEIKWAKEVFGHYSNIHFVENNKGADFEDMRLMSLCKHNITANSSFSWWGAWLNNNPNKKVIAPKTWFKDIESQKKSQDLIPKNWIKL